MTEFPIDPKTGLPKLPEGQVWKVEEFYVAFGILKEHKWVEIDKKGFKDYQSYHGYLTKVEKSGLFNFKKTYWYRQPEWNFERIWAGRPDNPIRGSEASVRVTKKNVVKTCENALREKANVDAEKELVGFYPPNKIEG